MKKLSFFLIAAFALSTVVRAQNPSVFSGIASAWDFAYGVNPQVPALQVDIGTTATGAGTIILKFGNIQTSDGRRLMPFSTNNSITVGNGSNAETVTPSAVSCATPTFYSTCAITATFSNTHGQGDAVASGTFGLAEAVTYQHTNGGLVAVDGRWKIAGGVVGTITGQSGWNNVTILDWRGTTLAKSYASTGSSSPVAYVVTAISLY